jgi:hypothetical protein
LLIELDGGKFVTIPLLLFITDWLHVHCNSKLSLSISELMEFRGFGDTLGFMLSKV